MSSKGVEFIEIDLWQFPARRDEMIARAEGRRTVPQVFVDGQGVGGSDDLQALEAAGGLDPLLGGGMAERAPDDQRSHCIAPTTIRSKAGSATAPAFDRQAAEGAITCPICGDSTVRKAMMAPAVVRSACATAAGAGGGPGSATAPWRRHPTTPRRR